MKAKILLIALSFFCFHFSQAQTGYYDYNSSQKEDIFFDGFSDNRNDWAEGNNLGNGARKGAVQNGYYYFESKTEKAGVTHKSIKLDESRDFEIEARIKFASGVETSGIGLLWGLNSDPYGDYSFFFSANGKYEITKYKGKYHKYKDWTESSIVRKYDYNKLTVRKKGSTMYFFMNEELVHTMGYVSFFGSKIGFQVGEKSVIHVDYLRVSYLKSGSSYVSNTNYNSSKGRNYYDFNSSNKRALYTQSFSSSTEDFAEGTFGESNQRVAKIINGYYQWESKNESAASTWHTIKIDQSKDFEIESRIRFVRGKEASMVSMFWGRGESGYRYDLGFNGNGKITIDKYVGEWVDFLKWQLFDGVNKTSYNKLTVRKVGNQMYFFYNEVLAHSMPFEPFYGDRIGFVCPPSSIINVDYLNVHYLEGGAPQEVTQVVAQNTPPKLVITEPDISRGFKVVQFKTVRVSGMATDPDGVYEVLINGMEANLQSNGFFSLDVPLAVGNNTIEVKATDVKMLAAKQTFKIERNGGAVAVQTGGGAALPPQKRLALVVGNSNYTNGGSLRNPLNDARSIKASLEQLGFTVLKAEDCTQSSMKRAIDEFGAKLQGYDIGLFFYAGHGIQVNGNNYLVPINAKLETANDVEYDCVRADRVLAKMESAGAKTNIVILDACRDNPFERSWQRSAKGTGLAFMNAPSGSIIAYATAPGNTASDGYGANGLYTESLLEEMKNPNLTILQMFQRVRAKVVEKSNGKQTPWESTSLTGDFFFKK
ncbi:caspase family protein [Flammeovirgaceae bacterium SG7u.111]|nr:caspase family protein [Flammeovirgaceae bacterium SG7u.132]WPO38283.1 caspase family protein [Flammeovirgaceae bacterium SG7u.111]